MYDTRVFLLRARISVLGTNFAMATAAFNICTHFELILLSVRWTCLNRRGKADYWLSSSFLEGYIGMPKREHTSSLLLSFRSHFTADPLFKVSMKAIICSGKASFGPSK